MFAEYFSTNNPGSIELENVRSLNSAGKDDNPNISNWIGPNKKPAKNHRKNIILQKLDYYFTANKLIRV